MNIFQNGSSLWFLWCRYRAFLKVDSPMKLCQGWPGQNRYCCFGHFLAPGRFFPSLVTFPLILFFVGVFGLIELPRISGFWWMIVVVCSGLLLLGALMACLQAMTTQPGFQVRRSVLPALTLSKDGLKTTSDLCKMYASCCRPPRFSDPAKKAEERLKAQEGFQKETQAHMTWNRYHVWTKMRRLGNLIWKRQKTSGTRWWKMNACGTWGNALRAKFNVFLALHIAMSQMLQCEVRGKRWILHVVHFLKCLCWIGNCVGARNHWPFLFFVLALVCLAWLFISVCVVDVVVNTSYLHEFHGLAFGAKDRNSGLSSVEVVQAQCFLQSEDHRQENAAISTFGKSRLGRPCDGLWHPSLCSFDCWGHGGTSWPGFNIHANRTAWKLRQRDPLPKFPSCSVSIDVNGKGLNMKQSAVQSSTEKSHTFSVQTFIEWFNRKIPESESMACLDAEVEEGVLERGMAHAPPEPWHRVDEGLCADLGLLGMHLFGFTYERMRNSSESCSSRSCQEEDVRSTATASFLWSDGAAAVWVKKIWNNIFPIGSMYGIFTYMYHQKI